jgi:hypothetical protein
MARKQGKSLTSGSPTAVGRLDRPMKFAGSSAGPLDPSAQPLPPTSLERFFTDEAAVTAFSQPCKPRA